MKASQGRIGLAMLAALVILPCIACGGNDSSHQTTQYVFLSIKPYSVQMDQGETKQFTASITGNSNQAVTWSIQETQFGGSISSQGLYVAPFKAGIYHIVATSVQDPARSTSVEVDVRSVTISLTPGTGDMEAGESQSFQALVTGTVDKTILWSVLESDGGSITSAGIYTAPAQTGTFHVVATNSSDKTATISAAVRVATVAVVITPSALGVTPGGTRQFSASVIGTLDDAVSWDIQEGATGGSISNTGLYTAPNQNGVFHVLAVSLSHPGVTAAALVRVGPSNFRQTGNMIEERLYHTATLLQNGNVLLAGGDSPTDWPTRATAELYDPGAGTFQATGSMSIGRDEHTATLLPNGKVLITGGGIAYWLSYNTAELYDPSLGTFSLTGQMTARRSNHTATLLKNGKVLIIGGVNWTDDSTDPNLLKSAELYDPASGTFSPAGSLAEPMWGHTATMLSDGRVLVTGGTYGYSGVTNNLARIYDPQTATFTEVGSMNQPRESHSATLLPNDQVLIVGGRYYPPGSDYRGLVVDDAQIFNSSTSQFSEDFEMIVPRQHHTATLLPNKMILIAGGASDVIEQSAEVFDPATSTFSITGSMGVARVGHTATLLNSGEVLITGGNAEKSAELYKPE